MAKKERAYIGLKSGLIKRYDLPADFRNEHKELCDAFDELHERMFSGVCDMFSACEAHKENTAIKIELCGLLDKFFDLGVKIENHFENTAFKSKKKYREYIMTYCQ
jgi:hypothetical protein